MNEIDAIVDRARERVNSVCDKATAKLDENERQMQRRIAIILFIWVPIAVVLATLAFGLTRLGLEILAAYVKAQ